MQLNTLYINLESYGVNEGRYTGFAKFKNAYGEVSLNLDPATSDAILAVVVEKLVTSAQSIGAQLTTACIEHKDSPPAIPQFLQDQAE